MDLCDQFPRSRAGAIQRVVAKLQDVPGDPRLRVDQERQDVDLRVPEIVSFISAAGQAARADAVTFRALVACRSWYRFQRITCCSRDPAPSTSTSRASRSSNLGALMRPDAVEPVLDRAIKRPGGPRANLCYIADVRVVVGKILPQPDWPAPLPPDLKDDGGGIVAAATVLNCVATVSRTWSIPQPKIRADLSVT